VTLTKSKATHSNQPPYDQLKQEKSEEKSFNKKVTTGQVAMIRKIKTGLKGSSSL
jgi:hypothetical protein